MGRLPRVAVTVGVALIAAVASLWAYDRYVTTPWTRDGRVLAFVVTYAPEVSGPVTNVPVVDNQHVHRGDTLFVIERERFQIAVARAEGLAAQRHAEYALAAAQAERRAPLGGVISREEVTDASSRADGARAAAAAADAELANARYDLSRTVVRSDVDGYVSDLQLRAGSYASVGRRAMAVVDDKSFWVYAYLEETKLDHVQIGDTATVELMGVGPHIRGHVESIGRGISDPNEEPNGVGLPEVNPVFTWVRLAQRFPVHIHLDSIPPGILISAGQTCNVSIRHHPAHAAH